ncbi:hypothetical protein BOTCAL_0287g00110 [Botryotinia calthae]|uniref:Uncharacterized protein n=1 Tax=Botryotinia calthae TaxID=38488 RepID=A0A4Y8CXS4_9HELO|nr:hypothetical protein BOTCAL_0287g00110 [Botryotinia calthae]
MSNLLLEISRLRDRAIQEIPRLRQLLKDSHEGEAVVIQEWSVKVTFKALGPWLERIRNRSKDWGEWEPEEEIEKANVVDSSIGAIDQRYGASSLV